MRLDADAFLHFVRDVQSVIAQRQQQQQQAPQTDEAGASEEVDEEEYEDEVEDEEVAVQMAQNTVSNNNNSNKNNVQKNKSNDKEISGSKLQRPSEQQEIVEGEDEGEDEDVDDTLRSLFTQLRSASTSTARAKKDGEDGLSLAALFAWDDLQAEMTFHRLSKGDVRSLVRDILHQGKRKSKTKSEVEDKDDEKILLTFGQFRDFVLRLDEHLLATSSSAEGEEQGGEQGGVEGEAMEEGEEEEVRAAYAELYRSFAFNDEAAGKKQRKQSKATAAGAGGGRRMRVRDLRSWSAWNDLTRDAQDSDVSGRCCMQGGQLCSLCGSISFVYGLFVNCCTVGI